MKSDISALLDDELEQGQANRAIDALRRDRELQQAWNVYHLIGDTLRQSPVLSPDLSTRVLSRLAEEPVIFVPARPPRPTPLRFALPLAASLMGMAAVGWIALTLNAPQQQELAAQQRPQHQQTTSAVQPPAGALKEYLVAHQAHSPSGGIQGVAPYVRTVSEIRQGARP
ncbi:MAG: sigma-E factor negative regulatory protein [Rhodocyclaceae bacterium]|nr:sigma-E factor negative regulatory protein [Rhodocyclaceae bacterium]